VDRMADLGRQYGFRVFRFSGSSTPGALLRQVAEKILQRAWTWNMLASGISPARRGAFRVDGPFGLYSIFFGIESVARTSSSARRARAWTSGGCRRP